MEPISLLTDVLDTPTQPDGSALSTALDAELSVDVRELEAAALGARCLRLRHQSDRLAVAIARVDAEFDRTRSFSRLDSSCTSAAQWLAVHTRAPLAVTRDAIRFARRLSFLPVVEAAILAGTITAWAAAVVTKVVSRPARAAEVAADQAWFVTQAATLAGHGLQRAADGGSRTTSPPRPRPRPTRSKPDAASASSRTPTAVPVWPCDSSPWRGAR